jgi:AmiR/NasT family two-component response regulator
MIDSLTMPEQTLAGTRVLDAAKGVLVALRRYGMSEAFSEILAVAAEYHVGPLAVSRALIDLAEGHDVGYTNASQEAAHRAWGPLLAGR